MRKEVQATKICTGCKEEKSTEEFHVDTRCGGVHGRRSKCKECSNRERREYVKNNKDKVHLSNRKWRENNRDKYLAATKDWYENKGGKDKIYFRDIAKHGWTQERYTALEKEQKGLCAICFSGQTSNRRLFADHKHSQVPVSRGLLCDSCNRALGLFKDSVNILRSAVLYLEKFSDSEDY